MLFRGIDWEEETNKVCVFQHWQNRFLWMHQKRSVLGCIPLLHRIFFFGRAMRPGWKNLKLYKIEFFLCALMTYIQNIERNFTFTGKRTDNEEQNEIGVTVWFERGAWRQELIQLKPDWLLTQFPKTFAYLLPSTLKLLKNIISLQSWHNFGERVLTDILTKTMAAIFDF